MADNQTINRPQIQIIKRVRNIPLVKSAIGYASDRYEKIKGYNHLVNSTFSCAENSINYVALTAKPVAMSFEKQLALADTLACHGLDKLEATVPVLKQSPEELYKSSVAKYEEIKKFGNNKIQVLKDFGYQKMNSAFSNQYAQAFVKTIDSAVELTDNALDHYLPPNEDENEVTSEQKDQLNVVQKMGSLSEKMRKRLLKQTVKQLRGLQKRSQEALEKMRYTVDLIQYTKEVEAAGRKHFVDSFDFVQVRMNNLWVELNREEQPEELNLNQTINQRFLFTAQRATRQVIKSYNNFAKITNMFQKNVRKSFELSTNFAKNVYKELSYVKNARDLSEITLRQILAGIEMMQTVMNNFLSPLVTSTQNGMTNNDKVSNALLPAPPSTVSLPFNSNQT